MAAIGSDVVDLVALGWVSGASSLDAVVGPLLYSQSAANLLGMQTGVVDALIEEASRTGPDQARWALLAEAEREAMALHQVLPLTAAASGLVTAPQAAGLVVGPDGSLAIGLEE
mgnify:CR=1 FL=1